MGDIKSINEPDTPTTILKGDVLSINEPPEPPERPVLPLVLESIEPDFVYFSADNQDIVARGIGFDASCKVILDVEELETALVSATELLATIPGNTPAGFYDLCVRSSVSESNIFEFEIAEEEAVP